MIPNVTIPEGERGPWRIQRFEVEKNDLTNLRLALDGRGCHPGIYTKLVHARRGVVMSDTTAEKRDHTYFVHKAHGHVLINGLGLGMCLGAVLQMPEVSQVTVVEIDADLIRLVGPHYTDPRCQIIHDNAFDYRPPKGLHYGAVWHDIWDTICEDNLPEMHRLHRKYGRLADWQGSWGRDRIEYERRRRNNTFGRF